MFLLKLSVLNVWRNTGHSIVTILATAVGVTVLVFMSSYNYGGIEETYEKITRLSAGHVQVHAPGFQSSLKPSLVISQADQVLAVCKSNNDVQAVCTRVKCEAIVTADEQSIPVILYGIDPQLEPQITQIGQRLLQGNYLSINGDHDVLMGDTLAKKLGADIGSDRLVIMTQAADGTTIGSVYRLQGIYHAGARELDERTLYTTKSSVQKLLGIGSNVHEIVILLKNREEAPIFSLWLKQHLKKVGNYDVNPWYDVMAKHVLWKHWYLHLMGIISMVVTVLIAAGIMNTMLMSVLKRVKELSVMLALGTSPIQLVQLILLESTVLQFIGMIVGLGIGLSLVAYYGQVGIPQTGLGKALEESYSPIIIYPHVGFIELLKVIWMLTVINLVVNLYPAWRAEHISPLEATRNL